MDQGMVVVIYINKISRATKDCQQQYNQQVTKVFIILLQNNMHLKIGKVVFDS